MEFENLIDKSSFKQNLLPDLKAENYDVLNNLIGGTENLLEVDIKELTLTSETDLLLNPETLTTSISNWEKSASKKSVSGEETDPLTGQKFAQIQKRSDTPDIIYPFPEPGEYLFNAYNIGSIKGSKTFSDFVDGYYDELTSDYYDRNDYYKFTLDKTSDLKVVLGNLYEDANLELLNSNGQLLQRSTASGSANEFISKTKLSAGDYYLRVYPADFEIFTPYDLTLNVKEVKPADLAGNNRRRARNMGVLDSPETFNDFVGDSDKHDYYKFEIKEHSQLDIFLDDLSDDANLKLRNSRGRVIEKSTGRGDRDESISTELDPGKYYLEVYRGRRGADTEYELSFDATAVEPDLAGNSRRQARNIGVLNGGKIFNDFVGSNDTEDYYKFRLNETSDVELVLSGLSEDADMKLLGSNGQLLQSFPENGTKQELIFDTLSKGTYYVQISPYFGANTDYKLSLKTVESEVEDIGGNSRRQAYNIGLLNSNEVFNEFVGEEDTEDYYKFRLNQTSDIEIVLSGLSEDADLQLLSSNGQILQSFPETGTTSELIFDSLNKGTYYVRVFPYFGTDTNYQLNIFNWTA